MLPYSQVSILALCITNRKRVLSQTYEEDMGVMELPRKIFFIARATK